MVITANRNELNHLAWLDELRGFAALAVVFSHYRVMFDANFQITTLNILGHGVQLFFVLSGFILYKIYLDRLNSGKAYARFVLRRYFRIAPLFYVVTIISFVIFYHKIYSPYPNLVSHFLILPMGFDLNFINGIIGIEWFVFVQFSFYLVFPIIIFLYKKNKYFLIFFSAGLSLSSIIIPWLLAFSDQIRAYIYFLPMTQLCFFLAGMFFADFEGASPNMNRIKMSIRKYSLTIGILAILLFLVTNFIISFVRSPFISFFLRLYVGVTLMIFIAFTYSEINKPKFIAMTLRWVGKRSYSVYLIHYPILMLMLPFLTGNGKTISIALSILALFALFLLSSITYRYIELVGIEFGRKLQNKIRLT